MRIETIGILVLIALAGMFPGHILAADVGTPRMQVTTAHHRYRIDVQSVPAAIPLSKLFTLQLAVFDAAAPVKPLTDVRVEVSAGMTHGART